jgi:hypothetical protein
LHFDRLAFYGVGGESTSRVIARGYNGVGGILIAARNVGNYGRTERIATTRSLIRKVAVR